jgi:very-short-patch-repair endonuclease
LENNTMRKRSQELRKHMTLEERILWYQYLRTHPFQWNRQKVIGSYIVDFYCKQAKLIVELDGSQHCDPEGAAYDRKRTAFLESKGLAVMRFSNLDVKGRFRQVCEAVDHPIQSRAPQ